MRVVVTGASGNVGTSVLRALADEPRVDEVVGLSRRGGGGLRIPKVRWQKADVTTSDLKSCFDGAAAIVHLAWLIQPGRDAEKLHRVNVEGSRRVFDAAAAADVPALVYASSVGAYSPKPDREVVDESWPTEGISTSLYSRQKAEVERILDRFENDHPDVRVARLRPALIFKRGAAAEIRRLFAGPFVPGMVLRPGLLPVLPVPQAIRFQAVHSHDVGDAYRRAAVEGGAQGAFNICAEPLIDKKVLREALGARIVEVSRRVARSVAAAAFYARLQPSEPGWLDMAFEAPVMSAGRAADVLGWRPRHDGAQALVELLEGIAADDGFETPPLSPDTGGRLRARELAGGIGAREVH